MMIDLPQIGQTYPVGGLTANLPRFLSASKIASWLGTAPVVRSTLLISTGFCRLVHLFIYIRQVAPSVTDYTTI